MGHSLVCNYVHLVFSTKYREPTILPSFESDLYAYIGGICNRMECPCVKVGGYRNHVHILFELSKNRTLVEVVKELKTASSKWVKTRGPQHRRFYWQRGYGAFSVDYRGVHRVAVYIERQREHHSKIPFEQEFLTMLNDNNMVPDMRYLWD